MAEDGVEGAHAAGVGAREGGAPEGGIRADGLPTGGAPTDGARADGALEDGLVDREVPAGDAGRRTPTTTATVAAATAGAAGAAAARPRPTVYDVAERAGVSIATVSRVLRRPDAVRPETGDRVREAVAELGYVASAAARGLAGRRTGVLGFLLPAVNAKGVDGPEPEPATAPLDATPIVDDRMPASTGTGAVSLYYDEVVRGAEDAAWRRGFALLAAAGPGSSREVLLDEIAGRVDGLVVLAASIPDDLLARIARTVPVVIVADASDEHGFDRVAVANAAGMSALVGVVLAGGRVSRIAYVSGPADSPDERDRRAGFDAAVAEAPGVEVVVRAGDFGEARGRQIAADLVAEERARPGSLPDAIVCSNDQAALGVLAVLHAAGVDVPGRVLVTGFDGVDAGRFSLPRLTTVRQPMEELGRIAVRTLAERIADPGRARRTLVLPVEIVLRESCPPVEG